MSSMKTDNQLHSQANNDDIDLKEVFAALLRQKFLFGGLSIAALIVSTVYAQTRKPVWEGSFQIVLENKDGDAGGRLAQLAPMLSNLAGLGAGSKSSLRTEVKVLQSPSVLKPIYDFVKTNKSNAGIDISKWSYQKWLNKNVSIKLFKGTSVLNLAYRDSDQDLIIPVLEQISETYQAYSGRDRQRGLTQAVTYLDEQIDKLQQRSNQSMRDSQNYALNNGLGLQDGLPAQSTGGGTQQLSVERSREIARNKVNSIRQQIAAARSVGGARLFQAPQLKANAELYSELQKLEAKLNERSALLTPQDQSIQALNLQRKSLIAYINQQTIDLLQGELLTAEAELASLTRPRDVVLKHRELVRVALRDEKILSEMEAQLQSMRLDQARQTDPWELISNPTLMDKPVAPRKMRIVVMGTFAGILLGGMVALIRDRRSGLVFSEDELKALLPCPILERLPVRAPERWQSTAELLVNGPLANVESVGLIPVGAIPIDQLENIQTCLKLSLGAKTLVVTDDLLASRGCSTQILVVAPGAAQRQQLQQLRKQLALQGTHLSGWLLLDPSLEG